MEESVRKYENSDEFAVDALTTSMVVDVLNALTEAEFARAQMRPCTTNFMQTRSFSKTIQNLMMHYNVKEEYFIVEIVKKAINSDDFVADALIAFVVDDKFNVL